MPTNITIIKTEDCEIEEVKDYYRAFLKMVQQVKYWPDSDIWLERFLDRGDLDLGDYPPQFKELCQIWDQVRVAADKLGMPQELSLRKLRALARSLHRSCGRCQYYVRFLRSHINAAEKYPELVSVIEVEERYQHYLYRKERHFKGLGLGPRFKTWLAEGNCPVTFYSILS